MRTVKEVSRLTGVSVRTLHHYDAIGLLKPTKITDAGYRLYDDTALGRLQNILLFRELQFPLKEIKKILNNPDFDSNLAITQQIRLLELQQERIGKLITFAREIQEKGVCKMEFDVFDKSNIEQYKEEVKSRWGQSEAYQEFVQKQENGEDFDKAGKALMALFEEIGMLRELPPSDGKVQGKICELQGFITKHYYNCTEEILKGLGTMYAEDERFRQNIDKAGGNGTAELVRRAIEVYCREQRAK